MPDHEAFSVRERTLSVMTLTGGVILEAGSSRTSVARQKRDNELFVYLETAVSTWEARGGER